MIYRSRIAGPGTDYATTLRRCHSPSVGIERTSWEAGSPDEILVAREPGDGEE